MHHSGTIIESQVDWLTVTSPQTDRHEPFNHWARLALEVEEAAHNRMRPFTLKGYEGLRCGGVRHGIRQGGAIVQLSGQAAADRLDTALDLARNVTRVDIAVTVKLTPPEDDLERQVWSQLRANYPQPNPPIKASIIESLGGGATVYVGSRTSERMLRIYDKHAESDAADDEAGRARYLGCHRYELEVKGGQARPTALSVSEAPLPGFRVASMVGEYCYKHGIDHSVFTDAPMGLIPGFRRRSDTDSKLKWLHQSVSPTVDWLRSNGNQARVLHALGYDSAEAVALLALDECQQATGMESEE
jgi:Replication initiation factor